VININITAVTPCQRADPVGTSFNGIIKVARNVTPTAVIKACLDILTAVGTQKQVTGTIISAHTPRTYLGATIRETVTAIIRIVKKICFASVFHGQVTVAKIQIAGVDTFATKTLSGTIRVVCARISILAGNPGGRGRCRSTNPAGIIRVSLSILITLVINDAISDVGVLADACRCRT
jgi:hypothetical protein